MIIILLFSGFFIGTAHESGHYFYAKYLGFAPEFGFSKITYTEDSSLNDAKALNIKKNQGVSISLEEQERLNLVMKKKQKTAIAGPLINILFSTIFLFLIFIYKSKINSYLFLAFYTFNIVSLTRGIFSISLVIGNMIGIWKSSVGDEGKITQYFEIPHLIILPFFEILLFGSVFFISWKQSSFQNFKSMLYITLISLIGLAFTFIIDKIY